MSVREAGETSSGSSKVTSMHSAGVATEVATSTSATVTGAIIGIPASTGDTVFATGSAPTEAFAPPLAPTTTVGFIANGTKGAIFASTPRQTEDGLGTIVTSPLRTRSGILRTEKPRKRARTLRTTAPTIAPIGEERPQVTWCPMTYPSATRGVGGLNPLPDIHVELDGLNIHNRNISQHVPFNINASSSLASAPYSIATNNARFSLGLAGVGDDAAYMRAQYSWAGGVGGLSSSTHNSAYLPGIGRHNTGGTFSNADLNRNVGAFNSTASVMSAYVNNFASPTNASQNPLTRSSFADITLSSSQVATRQVMLKDLPFFSGNPEEWPVFITNFEQSTERCGFTDQENLIRLQKCLKGPALEAVRGKLMMPSTVSLAIETLRMLYGRPDVIHHTLQRKLRQHPIVKMEKMDTLINFALAVQNYRATMQAIGLSDYLNDPMLINKLLTKLPCDLKLDWGRFRMTRLRVDLMVFDEWLFSLATCASQVTPLGYAPTQAELKSSHRRSGERLMVHEVVDKEKQEMHDGDLSVIPNYAFVVSSDTSYADVTRESCVV
ncbi:uncharacterized protein LOC118743590 [Rhagoletis pomonella]|uniref:uncharacterized protein LOC118743590 n=1 Tax=Rhagoletis pomonella TaxID=28610 RepID=UPI0017808294|nr:uncharacterized protein LOC118743590 [Rhagoletis pomonella]